MKDESEIKGKLYQIKPIWNNKREIIPNRVSHLSIWRAKSEGEKKREKKRRRKMRRKGKIWRLFVYGWLCFCMELVWKCCMDISSSIPRV